MSRRGARRVLAAGAVIGTVLVAACSSASAAAIAPPSGSVGATAHRAVPATISQIPLTNQRGQSVSLASWKGKTVVLVPFLTLCADICPFTTGDFSVVQRSLKADKAAANVVLVELSVDPGRDSPQRLAAYAKLTGASWQLVTETPANLAAMAKFFGFEYQTVPEDNPPDIDWWTGKPLTYDIDHSDGFVVINGNGVERFATAASPNYTGTLNPKIEKFLSPLGRQHQKHPTDPDYTPTGILHAISWTMQRPLSGPVS